MNVGLMKTKAEAAITESFEAVSRQLPGGAAVREERRNAIGTFAALGLPHRRIEEWKYTDLRALLKEAFAPAVRGAAAPSEAELQAALGPLAGLDAYRVVVVDGAFDERLSSARMPEGLAVKPLGEALAQSPDRIGEGLVRSSRPGDALEALNSAFATDGAVVRIADGAAPDKPVLLVFARAGGERKAVTTRNVISIGKGAVVTLVEAFVALPGAAKEGHSNAATEIVIGEDAAVTHVKANVDTGKTVHLGSANARIGAGAAYRAFQLTAGPGLARNQIFATFAGEGGRLDCSGVFLAAGDEHIDTTLVVDHAVPGCESRELYKGVLDGRARGIFQGKVIVRPDAQKSDGKQMAQALMLSPDAEFDSKPELEIYADDVVCGHGSTSAEIDPELVFYCMSRGIPEPQARALLIESFVGEAIEKVEDEAIRAALMAMAREWLSKRTAPEPGRA
ncbi:MAG: Fe-S cluster assembly protein SufD [Hyphomicrobiaceae bacterium]|nr:Fe-S cluster assembly protein SufD [Hyphomicrobiaceae bacterium]